MCKNYKKQIFFLILFFIFTNLFLFSNDDIFVFYSQPNLLTSKFITGICQDSYGRLWFGTKEGLACYDGISYKNYEYIPFSKDSIQSSQIQCLYKDPKKGKDGSDLLWIGTFEGFECFSVDNETFCHYNITDSVVCSFLRDSRGRLWIGTLNGLSLFNEITEEYTVYSKESLDYYIGNNSIRNLYEDSKGIIYACTYDGIWEYNEDKDIFERTRLIKNGETGSSGVIYNILEDDGKYWISIWDKGLLFVDSEKNIKDFFSFSNNKIYCINDKFSDDVLLIGTWGGGMVYFNKITHTSTEYTTKRSSQSLSSDFIFSIFLDNYGSLWVGTNGGGVNIYDTKLMWLKLVLPYDTNCGGKENTVSDLKVDKNGNLWIALLSNGIVYYDIAKGIKKSYKYFDSAESKLISNSVFKFYIDKNNDVWAATDKGLCKYNKVKDIFVPIKLYNNNVNEDGEKIIYAITGDDKGFLWIGTYDGGLIKFSPKSGIIKKYKHDKNNSKTICSDLIFNLLVDKSKNLWIGTNKGLAVYREETDDFITHFYDINNKAGISSNRINSFFEDSSGKLWVGTHDGGVCIFESVKNSLGNFNTAKGLPANRVTGMIDMDDGSVCVASAKGLTVFNRNMEIIYNYTFYDYERRFTTAPVRIGNYWFLGSEEGVLGVDFNYFLSFKKREALVKIRNINVNGRKSAGYKFDMYKTSNFSHSENNISFEFSSLDLSPFSRPFYVYMLEGFDKNWNNANLKNYVQYTNLKPGVYTFKVKDISVSEPKVESFSFIIEKPFWASPLMIVIYIISFFLFVFISCKIRLLFQYKLANKRLQEEQQDLLSINERLILLSTQDELTGIGNRRQLDTTGKELWKLSMENKQYMSFIMIDIDLFKQYNDLYGHQAGDDVLKIVAQTLKKNIRLKYDFVGRYGGEEFLVLLYNGSSSVTMKIAEKLRNEVKNLKIEHSAAKNKILTISLGTFSAIPNDDLSYEMMLSYADEALYRAKESGKDCCIMYGN